MELIRLDHVDAFRGHHRVFETLNLKIDTGCSTAILGPNGAGKTTLLKLLSREIYPAKGTVTLFGQSRGNVWDLRKRLGLVSADLQYNYHPHANGWAVILSGFYASNHVQQHQVFDAKMWEAAKQVAAELDLSGLVERPYCRMSTGQQRRFLLARALVHRPEVLVLDEPTTGLDLAAQFHYFHRMNQWISEGKTLVLVTHHVHEVLPGIRKVILLKQGKVMAEGTAAEVMNDRNLSQLFEVSIRVVERDGYYQAIPGEPSLKKQLPGKWQLPET